jgi:hypothetical protein
MSAARSTDTNTLKANIHLYAPLDYKRGPLKPPVDAESKIDFGFNHNGLGRLLVPAIILDDYDNDPVMYNCYFFLCLLCSFLDLACVHTSMPASNVQLQNTCPRFYIQSSIPNSQSLLSLMAMYSNGCAIVNVKCIYTNYVL